jgi:hypothetical protein
MGVAVMTIKTSEALSEAMKAQGGSCFPYACEMKDGGCIVDTGLTLRDWFAGQALRAVLDTDDYSIAEGRKILAANCYQIADAMLAERSKP